MIPNDLLRGVIQKRSVFGNFIPWGKPIRNSSITLSVQTHGWYPNMPDKIKSLLVEKNRVRPKPYRTGREEVKKIPNALMRAVSQKNFRKSSL